MLQHGLDGLETSIVPTPTGTSKLLNYTLLNRCGDNYPMNWMMLTEAVLNSWVCTHSMEGPGWIQYGSGGFFRRGKSTA